jgi:acetyltransferase
VLGVKAYPSLAAVPVPVELAVIVTPAPTVPGIIGECVAAGVKGAIIVSAGFRECGPAGADMERQIRGHLRGGSLRVLGPNCQGVVCSRTGLNATFAPATVRPGRVGFISQSGALLTALLSGDVQAEIGCSTFISVGSMIDVGWAECLDYLSGDEQTEAIGLYMESIGDAPAFFDAVRRVTPHKPILVLKAGRTAGSAQAAAAHTGAHAACDHALEEAFRRTGALRVETLADLFGMAALFTSHPPPRGRRLTILSNSGGPAVLAADAAHTEGGELAPLAPATVAALDALLPGHGSRQNPIDVGDDAGPERLARAAELAAHNPSSDSLLVILTPHGLIDPEQAAERLGAVARASEKPILASWMWGAATPASLAVLNRSGVPNFACPQTAVRALGYLWRHGDNLRGLHQTGHSATVADTHDPERSAAEDLIHAARQAGRTQLSDVECRRLLAAYSLPILETRPAATEVEAVEVAAEVGYPVLLRPRGGSGSYLTKLGGLHVYADNPVAVRRAYHALEVVVKDQGGLASWCGVEIEPMIQRGYEIMIGSTTDPHLGPVLNLGAGGPWATVSRHRTIALPPLTSPLVQRMFEQVALFGALGAAGGKTVDLATLEQFLIRFSRLVVEQRWIKEISINPLLASAGRLLALDTRVVLHGLDVAEEHLPQLAIRHDFAHDLKPRRTESASWVGS